MTIKEHFHQYLTRNGLWPEEATAVLVKCREHRTLEAMATRWEDHTEGYPDTLLSVVTLSVRAVAVEWIDANKPKHFARPMFVNEG